MDKGKTFEFIAARQKRWAASLQVSVDPNGRVRNLNDNLFAVLHPLTESEISEGDGDEFGTSENVGKMFSLWSSSTATYRDVDR
jgi:hypothetical protein